MIYDAGTVGGSQYVNSNLLWNDVSLLLIITVCCPTEQFMSLSSLLQYVLKITSEMIILVIPTRKQEYFLTNLSFYDQL